MAPDILHNIGSFSVEEQALFEKVTSERTVSKNEILLNQGEICQSIFYVLSGSFIQYQEKEIDETIIDLHLQDEWMCNNFSLTTQSPSETIIKAFTTSEVLELSLTSLHYLISISQAFLKLGMIFNQANTRTYLFDNALNPTQKYNYIQKAKPQLAQVFPIKMIASYLKIAPETLSRVRAKY